MSHCFYAEGCPHASTFHGRHRSHCPVGTGETVGYLRPTRLCRPYELTSIPAVSFGLLELHNAVIGFLSRIVCYSRYCVSLPEFEPCGAAISTEPVADGDIVKAPIFQWFVYDGSSFRHCFNSSILNDCSAFLFFRLRSGFRTSSPACARWAAHRSFILFISSHAVAIFEENDMLLVPGAAIIFLALFFRAAAAFVPMVSLPGAIFRLIFLQRFCSFRWCRFRWRHGILSGCSSLVYCRSWDFSWRRIA